MTVHVLSLHDVTYCDFVASSTSYVTVNVTIDSQPSILFFSGSCEFMWSTKMTKLVYLAFIVILSASFL